MRIRTQFILTLFLFGVILLLIAASAVITHQRIEKTSEQEDLVTHIAQGANDLSYLANDYLIYREDQQLRRWQSRFESFSRQVASLNVDRPEQQALVRNIQANQRRLKEVFDSAVSAVGSSSQNQRGLDPAFLQVSWSRLAVQSQGLVSDASRLSQRLHQQMDQITETRTVLLYVTVGLFGAFLLASYRFTYRRILKSIATLQAGTAVIGSGDLDFKIKEKKNDEIGDLSHAFNRMTADLKGVTASKVELEREIAERMKAEEALRQQREWLRVTLSSIGDAVLTTDTRGRITFLNPVAIALTGWRPEEALGQPLTQVFQIMNEKTRQPAEDFVARVLKEQRVIGLANDTALIARDGREVPIEDSAAPILDAAGNVTGVVLVFHDVTQKRQAQAALRESEERFRNAFANAAIGFAMTMPDGRFVDANSTYCAITGYRIEELRALVFPQLIHPGDHAANMKLMERMFAGEIADFAIENRYVRKDGQPVWVRKSVSLVRNAQNIPQWTIVLIEDISERKRAEEAVRQRTLELQQLAAALDLRVQERTAELANANEALRNLSSRLLSAHEEERKRVAGEIHDVIGACLGAIKFKVEGTLRSATENAPQSLTDSLKVVIPVIQEGIEECRRIQQDLRPSMLDDLGLMPTLSWFCRRFQTIYSGIRVEQLIAVSEEEIPGPRKIVLYRVTQEAMNNIAKHSKADLVRLGLQKADGRIELSIEDNGKGFDVGHALASESTRRGLGLTSMKELVEFSGGSFQVESVEGKGTIVRASWPI